MSTVPEVQKTHMPLTSHLRIDRIAHSQQRTYLPTLLAVVSKLTLFMKHLTALLLTAAAITVSAADTKTTARWIDAITVSPVGVARWNDLSGSPDYGAGLDLGVKVNKSPSTSRTSPIRTATGAAPSSTKPRCSSRPTSPGSAMNHSRPTSSAAVCATGSGTTGDSPRASAGGLTSINTSASGPITASPRSSTTTRTAG